MLIMLADSRNPLRAASNPAGNSNHLCRFGVYLANFGSGGA